MAEKEFKQGVNVCRGARQGMEGGCRQGQNWTEGFSRHLSHPPATPARQNGLNKAKLTPPTRMGLAST